MQNTNPLLNAALKMVKKESKCLFSFSSPCCKPLNVVKTATELMFL